MGCHLGKKKIVLQKTIDEPCKVENLAPFYDSQAFVEKIRRKEKRDKNKPSKIAKSIDSKKATESSSILSFGFKKLPSSSAYVKAYGHLLNKANKIEKGVEIIFYLRTLFSEQMLPIKVLRRESLTVEITLLTCYNTIKCSEKPTIPSFLIKTIGSDFKQVISTAIFTFEETGMIVIKLAPEDLELANPEAIVKFTFPKSKTYDLANEKRLQGIATEHFSDDDLVVMDRIDEYRESSKGFADRFLSKQERESEEWSSWSKRTESLPMLEMKHELNKIAEELWLVAANLSVKEELEKHLKGRLVAFSDFNWIRLNFENASGVHAIMNNLFLNPEFLEMVSNQETRVFGFTRKVSRLGKESILFLFFRNIDLICK